MEYLQYKRRLLRRCIHHFKSDLINKYGPYAHFGYWSLAKQSSFKGEKWCPQSATTRWSHKRWCNKPLPCINVKTLPLQLFWSVQVVNRKAKVLNWSITAQYIYVRTVWIWIWILNCCCRGILINVIETCDIYFYKKNVARYGYLFMVFDLLFICAIYINRKLIQSSSTWYNFHNESIAKLVILVLRRK